MTLFLFVRYCDINHRFVGYYGGIMSGFVLLLGAAVVFIWIACTAIVATLGFAAHRRHPRVVMADPWEQAASELAWDRLRQAVMAAQVTERENEPASEPTNVTRWRTLARRPRRAARRAA
jgi:hypothetical protein